LATTATGNQDLDDFVDPVFAGSGGAPASPRAGIEVDPDVVGRADGDVGGGPADEPYRQFTIARPRAVLHDLARGTVLGPDHPTSLSALPP